MTGDLVARWVRIVGEAGRDAAADLIARYREPHRRYHGVRHLVEVLDAVDELAGEAADADAVRLAAWFHDAVYETGAHAADAADESGGAVTAAAVSNEEAGARLAESVLGRLGLAPELVAETARLVRLTESHTADPWDANAAVLCDADLAVLAADPARYAQYAADVREEYRSVPDALFRPGRARILRALLAEPTLFRTSAAHARHERRARANVAAELAQLTDSAED